MSKEDYLEYREWNPPPILLFYEYYLDNKKTENEVLSLEDFSREWFEFIGYAEGRTILTSKGPRFVAIHSIIDKMRRYFDKKFGI